MPYNSFSEFLTAVESCAVELSADGTLDLSASLFYDEPGAPKFIGTSDYRTVALNDPSKASSRSVEILYPDLSVSENDTASRPLLVLEAAAKNPNIKELDLGSLYLSEGGMFGGGSPLFAYADNYAGKMENKIQELLASIAPRKIAIRFSIQCQGGRLMHECRFAPDSRAHGISVVHSNSSNELSPYEFFLAPFYVDGDHSSRQKQVATITVSSVIHHDDEAAKAFLPGLEEDDDSIASKVALPGLDVVDHFDSASRSPVAAAADAESSRASAGREEEPRALGLLADDAPAFDSASQHSAADVGSVRAVARGEARSSLPRSEIARASVASAVGGERISRAAVRSVASALGDERVSRAVSHSGAARADAEAAAESIGSRVAEASSSSSSSSSAEPAITLPLRRIPRLRLRIPRRARRAQSTRAAEVLPAAMLSNEGSAEPIAVTGRKRSRSDVRAEREQDNAVPRYDAGSGGEVVPDDIVRVSDVFSPEDLSRVVGLARSLEQSPRRFGATSLVAAGYLLHKRLVGYGLTGAPDYRPPGLRGDSSLGVGGCDALARAPSLMGAVEQDRGSSASADEGEARDDNPSPTAETKSKRHRPR